MPTYDVNDLFSVEDHVVVITGGGSGLGVIMAIALTENGASKVFILGRRSNALERTASSVSTRNIIPVLCDVSSKESLAAAATTISQQTPFVNTVIANSGITGPVVGLEIHKQAWAVNASDYTSVLDVNVIGAYNTFYAFVALLSAGNTHQNSPGKSGIYQSQFITTSSCSAFQREENLNHMYGISKAAVVHMTKMLSTTFAPFGIRVNCIAPGIFPSEMTSKFEETKQIPGSIAKEKIPCTRMGTAKELAGAILFLTSRAGAYVSGNVLLMDSGMVAVANGSY